MHEEQSYASIYVANANAREAIPRIFKLCSFVSHGDLPSIDLHSDERVYSHHLVLMEMVGAFKRGGMN
jgi:hypothetical protein